MILVGEERNRIDRILFLYDKLIMGDIVYKSELTTQFNVHERTIRRDIQDIKYYMARFYINRDIMYDPKVGGYRLIYSEPTQLSWSRWIALSKVLLDSQLLTKEESMQFIHSVASRLDKEKRQNFIDNMRASLNHYKSEHQKNRMLDKVELVYQALSHNKRLYLVQENKAYTLCPVGIVYKRSHFFLAALLNEPLQKEAQYSLKPVPIMIRENLSIKIDSASFTLPSSFSFDEEEFKKRCMPP